MNSLKPPVLLLPAIGGWAVGVLMHLFVGEERHPRHGAAPHEHP